MAITTTCPKCNNTHDRGAVDGIDVYRCLHCGITYKAGADGIALDRRIVSGARCVWWGHISEVGALASGLPCCPTCRSVLLETESLAKWWEDIEAFEANGNPGYRALIKWTMGKHYPTWEHAKFAKEADDINRKIVERVKRTPGIAEREQPHITDEILRHGRARELEQRPTIEADAVFTSSAVVDAVRAGQVELVKNLAAMHAANRPGWVARPTWMAADLLKLLAATSRRIPIAMLTDAKPGDLVIEVSSMHADHDSIGVLLGHDLAPQHPGDPIDGSVAMREVWDIFPLSGNVSPETGFLRYENALFMALPEPIQELARKLGVIARKPADG